MEKAFKILGNNMSKGGFFDQAEFSLLEDGL